MQIKFITLFIFISISQIGFSQLYPTCETISENIICDYQELHGWTTRMNDETSNQGPNNECTVDNPHDRSWFAFIAPDGDYTMRFGLSNCSTPFSSIKGAQVTLYNSCDFTDVAYCSPLCTQGIVELPSDTLAAGQTYYVLLDGCFGSVCDLQVLLLGSDLESYCYDDDYIPMDTITDWYTAYGGLGSSGSYYYQHVCDTIINDIKYRKILPDPYESIFQTRYIRESRNERKVYLYNVSSEQESVLYDFSLELGDSYTVFNRTLTVIGIDSVDSEYGPLKRWRLDGAGPSIYCIEALGSEDLFLSNLASDPVFGLVCAFNQEEKVFGIEDCMTPPRWATNGTLIEATICNGLFYDFAGKSYYESGIFTDTLANVEGQDSIITLDLTVSPTIEILENVELCEGETYFIPKGFTIATAGTFSYEYFTDEGCLVNATYIINFASDAESIIDWTLCENESVIINGIIYDSSNPSGTELLFGASASGCDSTVNIDLTFFDVDVLEITESICQGESIIINGIIFDETSPSGNIVIPNGAANGCDSIISVELAFISTIVEDQEITICEGQQIEIDGVVYSEPGAYTTIYEASTGCDSVVILNLNQVPISETSDTLYFCPNDTIDAGIYQTVLTGTNGCDTVVILTAIELLPSDPQCTTSTYDLESFNLDISPNPFDHSIHLSSEQVIQSMEVISISGVRVASFEQIDSQEYSYDGSYLAAGVYIVTVRSKDKIAIKRIVKN